MHHLKKIIHTDSEESLSDVSESDDSDELDEVVADVSVTVVSSRGITIVSNCRDCRRDPFREFDWLIDRDSGFVLIVSFFVTKFLLTHRQ